MNNNEEYLLQALRCGAAGYLLKNISPQELEQAIRTVARGEKYLSTSISTQMIPAYLSRVSNDITSPFERLTPRQSDVLHLVAEGNSSKEIARTLTLSVKTVEMHRTQLMAALDIHDIAGLVRYAIRIGLISPEIWRSARLSASHDRTVWTLKVFATPDLSARTAGVSHRHYRENPVYAVARFA